MAYKPRTKPEKTSVSAYLEAVADEKLRSDGKALLTLFEDATGEPAVMWGPSIIGFGQYAYTYTSGHSGTSAKVGFAVRSTGLVLYFPSGFETMAAELAQVGPQKLGKACLYLKNMERVDRQVLSAMIRISMEETDRRYPPA
jgi:Domain of unknown function (DU1801)